VTVSGKTQCSCEAARSHGPPTLTEAGQSIACHVALADYLVDDAVTVAPDVEVARRL
jgi:hypothetical protein